MICLKRGNKLIKKELSDRVPHPLQSQALWLWILFTQYLLFLNAESSLMKQSGKLFSLRGSSSLQIPVGAFTSQGDPEHGPDSVKHYMGINEIKMF